MAVLCDFIGKSENLSNIYKEKHMEVDSFKLTKNNKFKAISNYDLGINFVQQEYTENNQFTSEAVVREDTAVLAWGKWPKNCENGRISFDSGKNFFYIISRESDKKLILDGVPRKGKFGYSIRLTEFDLGEVKLCANRSSNLKFEEWSISLDEISKNVANEYVSVSDAKAISTVTCSNVVSASVAENKDAESVYYWLVFYLHPNIDENAEVKIFNKENKLWRIIARSRAGFWEYNNSPNAKTETWVLASANDFLHAVSEAISSKKVNRMAGEDLVGITEQEWSLLNGSLVEAEYFSKGITLNSADPKNNPAVSQFCLDCEK